MHIRTICSLNVSGSRQTCQGDGYIYRRQYGVHRKLVVVQSRTCSSKKRSDNAPRRDTKRSEEHLQSSQLPGAVAICSLSCHFFSLLSAPRKGKQGRLLQQRGTTATFVFDAHQHHLTPKASLSHAHTASTIQRATVVSDRQGQICAEVTGLDRSGALNSFRWLAGR